MPDHSVRHGQYPRRNKVAEREVRIEVPVRFSESGLVNNSRLHRPRATGPARRTCRSARRQRRHRPQDRARRASKDGGPNLAVQSGKTDSRKELGVPPGEAFSIQRLWSVRRPRPFRICRPVHAAGPRAGRSAAKGYAVGDFRKPASVVAQRTIRGESDALTARSANGSLRKWTVEVRKIQEH